MAAEAARGQETEPPFRRPDFLIPSSFGPPLFRSPFALGQARAARGAEAARSEIVAPRGGLSVTKRTCLNAILRTALAAGASLLVAAGTAVAQKQGGSITVGQ